MDENKVITHYEIHPLANLLPEMTEEEFAKLKEDMAGIGQVVPIVLLDGKIIDGRHRYKACCELGFEPIIDQNQYDGMSPHDIIRSMNVLRRHLTASQRAMFGVALLDYIRKEAKQRQIEGGCQAIGRKARNDVLPSIKKASGNITLSDQPNPQSTDIAAEKVKVSGKTMRDAVVVVEQGTEEEKKEVIDGKISVSKVAREVRQRKKAVKYAEHPEFNRTSDSAIEWAKYTWNPVTGCKHGCEYCYAKKIAMRQIGVYEGIGFEPHFHEERLAAPNNTKLPANSEDRYCFVVSMGDLFGEWVPDEWINKVMAKIAEHPEWTFLLLTKNPERYLKVKDIPLNAWMGASATNKIRTKRALEVFNKYEGDNILFLSAEPLQEEIRVVDETNDSPIDWLIVGSQTNPDIQPEWEWVESIIIQARKAAIKLYFKPNLSVRPKQKPITVGK